MLGMVIGGGAGAFTVAHWLTRGYSYMSPWPCSLRSAFGRPEICTEPSTHLLSFVPRALGTTASTW